MNDSVAMAMVYTLLGVIALMAAWTVIGSDPKPKKEKQQRKRKGYGQS